MVEHTVSGFGFIVERGGYQFARFLWPFYYSSNIRFYPEPRDTVLISIITSPEFNFPCVGFSIRMPLMHISGQSFVELRHHKIFLRIGICNLRWFFRRTHSV